MILDVLIDRPEELSEEFMTLFAKVNYAHVDLTRPVEAQVLELEERFGEPSIQRMLVYPAKHRTLGTVLSRRYVNAAEITLDGPLRLADMVLSPEHLSGLPGRKTPNRVLFLTPHCDEPYIGAALLHKLAGDAVFLYSFTHPNAEKDRIREAYRVLGLERDDYHLSSLKDSKLFREKAAMKKIIRSLLTDFGPTVVVSSSPRDANFDHVTVAQAAKEVVLDESTADLLSGYAIQSRHRNPQIFPLFSEEIHKTILQAFGEYGLGPIFKKYLPFLEYYLQMYSEPIFRMIGTKRLDDVYSLPLEANRISNYRFPKLLELKK